MARRAALADNMNKDKNSVSVHLLSYNFKVLFNKESEYKT